MPNDAITAGGHRIELSNVDKVLFPKSGITKGKLIDYYSRIAPVALPHFRDRALTMQRFPDGIESEGFFQKDTPGYFPEWIDRAELKKENGSVEYVLANNEATLIYLANQGCITPHLSLARFDKPDHPDRLIFDLDPSDGDFRRVRRAARYAKELLDTLRLPTFVQITGSRGLHIVVPLDRSAAFDEVKQFAREVAELLARRYPSDLTVEQRKNKRGDRVFLDYLRNAYGQTAVAPYAVRTIEKAPVATPLEWEEALSSDSGPQRYNVSNIFRRLAQKNDPWAAIAESAVSVAKAAERLAALLQDESGSAQSK